jgi:hypothetical protein
MHYGFKIVEDMIDGLNNWMDEKGYARLSDFRAGGAERHRLAVPQHELQDHRQHRSGFLYSVRPMPHRLRGHRAPSDLRIAELTGSAATK